MSYYNTTSPAVQAVNKMLAEDVDRLNPCTGHLRIPADFDDAPKVADLPAGDVLGDVYKLLGAK